MLISNSYGTFGASIIINERPITEYKHEGETWVEGREGSKYEIEIRNSSGNRVLAVVSVDGLSVMDGERATNNSSGYVLKPYDFIRIPGWRLDAGSIAAFTFGSRVASYAAAKGDESNVGVIGIRIFGEQANINWLINPFALAVGKVSDTKWVGSDERYSLYASDTQAVAHNSSRSLGTAFGEKQSFETVSVDFKRGPLYAEMIFNYDTASNLRARGIDLRRKNPVLQAKPQAFADGCIPPPGWRG